MLTRLWRIRFARILEKYFKQQFSFRVWIKKFAILTEEVTSALAGFPAAPLFLSNWNLEMLLFAEGGKPENPAENHQSKARTNYKLTQPEVNPGYFGGRLALSSLHHPCSLGRLGKILESYMQALDFISSLCNGLKFSKPLLSPYCHFIPHVLLLFLRSQIAPTLIGQIFAPLLKKVRSKYPQFFWQIYIPLVGFMYSIVVT